MAIPKRKRQKAVNAFGEELYVPEIQLPEFDTDLGFDTPDIETEDLNLDLFDYDREDNNSDVRYMRPRPARMPTACVRYDNADALNGFVPETAVLGTFLFDTTTN